MDLMFGEFRLRAIKAGSGENQNKSAERATVEGGKISSNLSEISCLTEVRGSDTRTVTR